MKKIDKLILSAFLGPFLITFLVVVFILLNIQMLKYFDDIIGKGLDWIVLGQLFFYFGVYTTPTALPLAVLLSALITYGNLGEHFELTAIKSAGISLTRTLQPLFIFVLLLTVVAFYINNKLQPRAALEAYSLLYDIKRKKPALDLREGVFYSGIPEISIKVNKKFPDGVTLKDVIIYDHRKNDGNKEVTVADSGKMYTILGERYLKLELFNGYNYTEGSSSETEMVGQPRHKRKNNETMMRSNFTKTQVVFDLSSFQLDRTEKSGFQGNRIMRDLAQLDSDIDSLKREALTQRLNYYLNRPTYFTYYNRKDSVILPPEIYRHKQWRDSVSKVRYEDKQKQPNEEAKETKEAPSAPVTRTTPPVPIKADTEASKLAAKSGESTKKTKPSLAKRTPSSLQKKNNTKKKATKTVPKISKPPQHTTIAKAVPKDTVKAVPLDSAAYQELVTARLDSVFNMEPKEDLLQAAANMARQVKSQVSNSNNSMDNYNKEVVVFEIQWHKIIANSFACIAMFLIGAPLGAIIKKGGLGVPFLISILFFIVYYVLSMQGEKFAKQGSVSVITGVWLSDIILFFIGVLFLRQARVDARLFDTDFYMVVFDKLRNWIKSRKKVALETA